MISTKKIALALIWLVSIASSQPPTLEYDVEPSGYGEEPIEEGEHQRVAPDNHGETTGQLDISPEEYNLDHRQSAFATFTNGLIALMMSFIQPLLTNLGIGTSNAIMATMLRRRLALIPEARVHMTSFMTRSKTPSATVRAL